MTNQMNNGSGAHSPQHVAGSASNPYTNSGDAPAFTNNMPRNAGMTGTGTSATPGAVGAVGAMPNSAMPNASMQHAVPPASVPPMNAATGMPNPTDPNGKKGKSKMAIIIGAIVAVVVVIAVVVAIIFGMGNNNFFDSSAQEGQAPYKSQEEIMAELNRVVEEGMLSISIASYIEFQDGTSPGTAYIENVPSNRYVLRVTITLDSNGEVVYQSGGIRPDSYIESITLSEDLPAGTYPATATFVAYDPDTLEEVGQAAAKITLSVQN